MANTVGSISLPYYSPTTTVGSEFQNQVSDLQSRAEILQMKSDMGLATRAEVEAYNRDAIELQRSYSNAWWKSSYGGR